MNVVFVLGTKAQFIKCKFILQYLHEAGFSLTIVDTGQHKEITSNELKNVSFPYKYISLSKNNNNISNIVSMFLWFLKILFTRSSRYIVEAKYCLIHGDTISTLAGLVLGKINNLKIVHLESGYKSHNLLRPFPEEIVRNIVTRYSDVLVVDGPEQFDNVKNMKGKKDIIKIGTNTIYDSVINSKNKKIIKENKLIVTIHRTENVYNKNRLLKFIDILIEIKKLNKFERIVWYCHDITLNTLLKNNFIEKLTKNDIKLSELLTHQEFIHELLSSSLVITDGGSISEECSILGLNTIIWRDVVENKRYLKNNVLLSGYEKDKIFNFINSIKETNQKIDKKFSPSKEFVNKFVELVN